MAIAWRPSSGALSVPLDAEAPQEQKPRLIGPPTCPRMSISAATPAYVSPTGASAGPTERCLAHRSGRVTRGPSLRQPVRYLWQWVER